MSRKTNFEELAVILSRYEKDDSKHWSLCAEDARKIVRLALKISRHAENMCNRETTDREQNACRKALETIRTLVSERYDSRIVVSAEMDPRGYVVRFKFPNGENNTWNNDFGIG